MERNAYKMMDDGIKKEKEEKKKKKGATLHFMVLLIMQLLQVIALARSRVHILADTLR